MNTNVSIPLRYGTTITFCHNPYCGSVCQFLLGTVQQLKIS